MQRAGYVLFSFAGVALLCLSWQRLVPIPITETLGFLTGVVCVWLIVKENVWNWPVGIANNIFYVLVFWKARLFADMSLQFVYIALGCLGLYRWLYGGKDQDGLRISRIDVRATVLLSIFVAAAVGSLTIYLRSVQDAAPFLDACTAVLSICAQYLLTKKILENWWMWIVTDAISVGLYLYKSLTLTAILYLVFLAMCITGLLQWRRTLRSGEASASSPSELAAL